MAKRKTKTKATPEKEIKEATKSPPRIICDTREKDDFVWAFRASDWCGGTISKKLDTGDYALEGFEHICVIDRKHSSSELAQNVLQARFKAELVRMKEIVLPYIVCEFPYRFLERYPEDSGIPISKRRFIKMRGPFLIKKLNDLMVEFPWVHWHFAESPEAARLFTRGLLKSVHERYYEEAI